MNATIISKPEPRPVLYITLGENQNHHGDWNYFRKSPEPSPRHDWLVVRIPTDAEAEAAERLEKAVRVLIDIEGPDRTWEERKPAVFRLTEALSALDAARKNGA